MSRTGDALHFLSMHSTSHPVPSRNASPARLFLIAAVASIAQNLLITGIFFYTQRRLGWGVMANLLFAAGQGAVYTVGALCAGGIARRWGRRRSLIWVYVFMAVAAGFGGMGRDSSAFLVIPLLVYTFFVAISWPMIESLVSAGLGAEALSRRIGAYNLVWAAIGLVSIAGEGAIIDYFPAGVFLIPVVLSLVCAALVRGQTDVIESADSQRHLAADPALRGKRTLALWLSRISLPATYIVEYSFMAMFPSLPLIRPLTTTAQTLIGSIWMAGRLGMFWLLGATTWWHARPRLLLGAVIVMGVAFLGVMLRGSDVLDLPVMADLPSMIFWQLVLGATFGLIYCASLYFGMVLSQGSTEHGGYHEALIGLGQILGPGAAAGAAAFWPGRLTAGITAVGVMIGLSIAAASGAAVIAARRQEADEA